MKIPIKYFSIAILVVFLSINLEIIAQVGIGIASPNANSMLDLTTTTKGFLPPRLSTAQKTVLGTQLIASNLPEDKGMLVFDNNLNEYYFWNGLIWIGLASGNYVDLTSDQMMIGGMKTFTGDLTVAGRLMIPMGEISYFDYGAYSVSFGATKSNGNSGNDNMKKIDPTVAGANPTRVKFVNDMFGTGTNSRLTYQGTVGRYFHIALSFSYLPGTANDTYVFGVARNGTVEDSSKVFIRSGSNTNDHQSSAMHVLLWLEPTEYIEFWAGNMDNSNSSIKIKSFNFVAIGM
jgi:hypothetical protein